MRIIAGEFRGRRLPAPASDTTRPITDRVKQSLFDILAPILPAARVYDCFAGTGSMGLESLSRAAQHVTFFEADHSAGALLKKNIQTLNVQDRSTVVTSDIFRWFAAPREAQAGIDLVFLDPPYRYLREKPEALIALAQQMATHHLKSTGVVVFRHDAVDELHLPMLREYDRRAYGGMVLQFLQQAG